MQSNLFGEMNMELSGLKEIEQKAYRSTFENGLRDVLGVSGFPALAIFMTGLIMFLRFLEKYPRASEDFSHD